MDPDPGGQKIYESCNTAEYALRGNLQKNRAWGDTKKDSFVTF